MACSDKRNVVQKEQSVATESTTIASDGYELIVSKKHDGLLILFPCNIEDTKAEFNITDIAIAFNITILLMNYNEHLWLSQT